MLHSASLEAMRVISDHTNGYMHSTDYVLKSATGMYEVMTSECSYIITDRLVNKEYTYSEYNAVRNELAHILWDIFKDDVEREKKKELGI